MLNYRYDLYDPLTPKQRRDVDVPLRQPSLFPKMYRYLTFLILFFVLAFGVYAEGTVHIPTPKVDERVELLGIVFRLAGAQEYQRISFKEYDDAINRHFADFKNHAVIQRAKAVRYAGIGHDAVITFAVHLAIVDGHVVLPDKKSEKTMDFLAKRWFPASPKLFVKTLDDFYVKSRFHDFFENHREMYEKTEAIFLPLNEKVEYAWFEKSYGVDNLANLRLMICLTSEDSGYGTQCRFKDGHEEFYAVLGASGPETKYKEDRFVPFLVHEFNHSFCNPLIDKHLKELKPAADRLFTFVAEKMARQAYPLSSIMLYEYLVRACEIQYLLDHGQTERAKGEMEFDRNLGFLWIDKLVESLGRYSRDREKYPTLESFMPEIVKLQNEIVTDEYIAELKKVEQNRPKVVSTTPVNGSKKVDPSIKKISVTFDRPMQGGMAWCTLDGNITYPKRSKEELPKWSEDRKTCTMEHVELESGKTYNIWLNSGQYDGFRSKEGVPLVPVHLTFTTSEPKQ